MPVVAGVLRGGNQDLSLSLMNSIFLAYSGVHEIFQLAAAAAEMGELDQLICSMVDLPGKFGARLGRLTSVPSARPLGLEFIPSARIVEYPWPLITQRLMTKLLPFGHTGHYQSNGWFDRHAAGVLKQRCPRLFVGSETCASHCLRTAKFLSIKTVLDVPGMPSTFLQRQALRAAETFGIDRSCVAGIDLPMHRRKLEEMAEADVVLACSHLQRQILIEEKFASANRIQVLSLWSDPEFWMPPPRLHDDPPQRRPLRVLYAGSISLHKGVPYLLQAVASLGSAVELTLVGGISREMAGMMHRAETVRQLNYTTKEQLRALYHAHDVLVAPSLGDSFGFVVLEAMAAGLPVIVSEYCGAPVPSAAWRVPAHDSAAIAARLVHYHDDPSSLFEDSLVSQEFVRQFNSSNYRRSAAAIFRNLLGSV